MKRTELKRKTPLKPGKPLKASKGFSRSTGLENKSKPRNPASKAGKTDKWLDKADKLWRQLTQLRWNDRCAMCGRSLPDNSGHNHHLIGRSSKLFRHDPENGMLLCMYCHEHSEDAPHVSPKMFMAWLQCAHPSIAEWIEENRGREGFAKPDYEETD
jgi:hypothetical protein